MKARYFSPAGLALVVFSVVVSAGPFQNQDRQVEPQVGQPGKDVVWVPTTDAMVDKMLDIARVTADDYVVDLGSGDGRTVIAAAKRGARALGVEYEHSLVELSTRRAADAGVANATFVQGDLFDADLSRATVVTMFLLPQINLKLRPRLLELAPGTRVVSNTFTMDDWSADDKQIVQEGCVNWCTALLWIVPARAEGTWQGADGAFKLRQRFQMVEGTLTTPTGALRALAGRLRGADLVLSANDTLYEGRLTGDQIDGTASARGVKREWSVKRVGE